MNAESTNAAVCIPQSKGWLDRAAISMAVLCGIHCLITPFLLIALPIIGKTFWISEDFHFWMLLLVIPTTTLAVFSGCRRHKDRVVAFCAAIGICILTYVTLWEMSLVSPFWSSAGSEHSAHLADGGAAAGCAVCCPVDAGSEGAASESKGFPVPSSASLLNFTGGLFLIVGHLRNFRLCRSARCSHGADDVSR